MNIQRASEKTGLTPTALRYYERMGFIPSIKRNVDGSREYTVKDIE